MIIKVKLNEILTLLTCLLFLISSSVFLFHPFHWYRPSFTCSIVFYI